MAYADYIIMVSRSLRAMKETHKEIKTTAKTTGLEVNVNKTKLLIQSRRNPRQTREINMEGDGIEIVEDFIYLGSKFHKDGEENHEITRRIKLANNAYFLLLSDIRSKDIHRSIKTKIYKTMIRLVLYYGCEGLTLNKKEESVINSFKRKILRRIYGPIKENGIWRIRYNKELYKLYKEPEISVTIKLKRLQWAGHVQRMDEECIPKKTLYSTTGSRRRAVKPRTRWTGAAEDAKK
ncbi:hypothetical protein B7P43_G17276 [Cryptotermes secundus]|uniref:Reverse transcriptase domain-containing protein n=1 Tax=Cryptotermes secundus TaxID=105785 RepID=A0A2J7R084_9NEOP|nr:hypothetical protein B7P43_G17276 [Cryptotermes secundus]